MNKTDDEYIAEYMGYVFQFERGHRMYKAPNSNKLIPHVKFNYCSSWDALMPVISNLRADLTWEYQLFEMTVTSDISDVHREVVKLVKVERYQNLPF